MRWTCVLFLGFVACGGSGGAPLPDGGLGTRTFGQPCATLDDCVSGLCLATSADTSVCTQLCTSDLDCPNTVSWGCISAEGFEPQVCGCVADADEERCGDSRDNDCDGVVDDCRVCDGRFVADDDPEHCGGCGNACGPGNLCLDGECVCANVDELLCDGACVDPNASPFHCGRCGRACEDGRECVEGECGCPESRPDLCEGRGCFDLADDTFNCGSCGVRCPLAQRCIEGECACPADAGSTLCGSECVDTDTNARHCGACGNVCPFGTTCVDGECDCGFGAEQCGSACVETSTDPANCGACGNACRGDQTCIAGTCRCPTGSTQCGGVCIDTSFDPDNCGACGVRCSGGASCDRGTCVCGVGEAFCGDRCLDVQSDATNCGRCGVTCAPGELCFRGTCTCPSRVFCGSTCMPVDDRNHCGACGNACGTTQTCSSGACQCPFWYQTACGSECYDLRSDPTNCGSCGNTCRPGELCSSSRCACPSGQTWCASAGTCVALNTTSNCGSCGNACRTGEVCSGGACRCPSGTSWCESAGTCVSLSTDAANCGACGNACRVGEVCSFSACRCPLSNQAWCDGACIDVASDEANCGSCGNVCRASEVCTSRSCRCPTAGHQWCEAAEACIDTREDPSNCGACGHVCPTGSECNGGTCACIIAGLSPCEGGCTDSSSDPSNCGACGVACGTGQTCDEGQCFCESATVGAGTELYGGFQSKVFWNGAEVLVLVERRGDPDGRELWAHRFTAEAVPTGAPVRIARNPNYNVDQVYPLDAAWNGAEWGIVVRSRLIEGVYSVHLYTLDAAGVGPSVELFAGRSTSRTDQQWNASRVFATASGWHVFGARNHAGSSSFPDALLLQTVSGGTAAAVRTVVPSSSNYALIQTSSGYVLSHTPMDGTTAVVGLDPLGNAVASLGSVLPGRPPGRQLVGDGLGQWILIQHTTSAPEYYSRSSASWVEHLVPDVTRHPARFSWGPNEVVVTNVEGGSIANVRRYSLTGGLQRVDQIAGVGVSYPDEVQHVQTGVGEALVVVRDGPYLTLYPVRFPDCP